MIRFLRQSMYLLLVPALAGCADRAEQEAQLPMSPETYADVMAELTRLRRLPPPARGQPERDRLTDSIRADILTRHGVTAEQLVAFAEVAGRDPTLMMGLSQAIAERADSAQAAIDRADSVASADTGAVSPPPSRAEDASPGDSVPGPRFAEPADSSILAPSEDTARSNPGQPARRRLERPARLRKPD